jgi:2-polyprenyl-3-methyl-5-hydroxy-6-metoxy-1,4-benzoquinol methylase
MEVGLPAMTKRYSTMLSPQGRATMSSEMPNARNYYNWIVSELSPYFGTKILDIGGGLGAHLEWILPDHEHVVSIDLSLDSIQIMNEKFRIYPGFKAMQADFSDPVLQSNLISQHFDTITCLNVLEHFDDDFQALKGMRSILRERRGNILLFVPSHRWLYGSMDFEAGHYRRYDKAYLKNILVKSGFEILNIFYFNCFGVVPWFVNNRILKKKLDAGGVNLQVKLFDRYMVPVLRRLEARNKPPVGQSMIAIARA